MMIKTQKGHFVKPKEKEAMKPLQIEQVRPPKSDVKPNQGQR